MTTRPINSYNIGSFTLSTEYDEQNNIVLVAENKAKNFKVIWGADTMPASVLPDAIETTNGEDHDNTMRYIELMLNMVYFIATTPFPVETYNEIIGIIAKFLSFKGILPDDLNEDDIENDVALAHAAEDASTEEKINKLAEEAAKEFKNATSSSKNKETAND